VFEREGVDIEVDKDVAVKAMKPLKRMVEFVNS
jgi:quinolinate synthase